MAAAAPAGARGIRQAGLRYGIDDCDGRLFSAGKTGRRTSTRADTGVTFGSKESPSRSPLTSSVVRSAVRTSACRCVSKRLRSHIVAAISAFLRIDSLIRMRCLRSASSRRQALAASAYSPRSSQRVARQSVASNPAGV